MIRPCPDRGRGIEALNDGERLRTGTVTAPGSPGSPLTDQELTGKYRTLANTVLSQDTALSLENAVLALPDDDAAARLLRLLLSEPDEPGRPARGQEGEGS